MNSAHSGQDANAGAAAFVTTHWSMVYAARGESEAAREALEKLCYTYWRPIYSFIRREGRNLEDAQDLTQSFFARIPERRDLDAVRKERDDCARIFGFAQTFPG